MINRYMPIALKIFIMCSVAYWLILSTFSVSENTYYDIFGILLALLPLFGAIFGFIISKGWGGVKSHVGKSIIFISASLVMWFFGQSVYLYYSKAFQEVPFPGLPDYFFVFIDPLYALGMFSIMKYSGASNNLKKNRNHFLLLLIPLVAIYLNYRIFFGTSAVFSTIDSSVLFDLIYSFGSTIIMTLTIITLVLSVGSLGGRMRIPIFQIFLGIVFQYIGDIAYSLVFLQEIRINGNIADFIFFLSISFITLGLVNFNIERLVSKQVEVIDAS